MRINHFYRGSKAMLSAPLLSAVVVASGLLSGCQPAATSSPAAAVKPATAAATTLAQTTLDLSATDYQTMVLADQVYSLYADPAGLHLQQAGQTLRSIEGSFGKLKWLSILPDRAFVAAVELNSNTLHLWQLTPGAAEPLQLLQQRLISSVVVEDLCFYHSTENQQLSLFLIGGRGDGEQLLLQQQSQWLAAPVLIRELNLPYDSKACAVNQHSGLLYVSEADRAIWQYQAEPEADEGRQLIQVQAPFGQLQAEIMALQVLPDGSVLALEEEPARLLQLSAQGELQQQMLLPQLSKASALSVTAVKQSLEVVISSEDSTASQDRPLALQLPQNLTQPIASAKPALVQVQPTLQTAAVSLRGDVMDDPAVWHHATDPAKSLILATDKRAGLKVYNMQGALVQQLDVGRLNNVDVREQLMYQGKPHDVAVATLRDDNSLQLFAIAPDGTFLNAGKVATTLTDIYGICQYRSATNGQHYVFVNDKSGVIEQFALQSDGQAWRGERVRTLTVPSQPEGCVADDASGVLFVGEEDEAIWRFAAEPDQPSTGEAIVRVDGKQLVDDIEGLALLRHQDRSYLLVSSQGNDSYLIYQAEAPYAAKLHFRITTNPTLGIDGVSETDGLDITQRSLGAGFEQGALIVQDGRNRMPEQGQNMKLVPMEQILRHLNPTQP